MFVSSPLTTDIYSLRRERDEVDRKIAEQRERRANYQTLLDRRRGELAALARDLAVPLTNSWDLRETAQKASLRAVTERAVSDLEAAIAGAMAEVARLEERRAEVCRKLDEAEGVKPVPAAPPREPEPVPERSGWADLDDLKRHVKAVAVAQREAQDSFASLVSRCLTHWREPIDAGYGAAQALGSRVFALDSILARGAKELTTSDLDKMREAFQAVAAAAERHSPVIETIISSVGGGEVHLRQTAHATRSALTKLRTLATEALALLDAGRLAAAIQDGGPREIALQWRRKRPVAGGVRDGE
jgi:hypothetical protein